MDTDPIAITEPVHRLEVFTGAGRQRTWRDEDKARIVAEIVTSGDLGLCRSSSPWIVTAAVVWLAASIAGFRGRKPTLVPERLRSRSTA